MILVDTSIWIEHVKKPLPVFQALLNDMLVMTHPLIIGELTCGDYGRPEHDHLLQIVAETDHAAGMTHSDLLHWIKARKLYCHGVGYIDMHLLAAAHLGHARALWTMDGKLQRIAQELGVAFQPANFVH